MQESYYNHPCIRDCRIHKKMDCFYNFTVEYYQVLTRDCLDCGLNVKSDCFKKNCISANGISRTIKVISYKFTHGIGYL